MRTPLATSRPRRDALQRPLEQGFERYRRRAQQSRPEVHVRRVEKGEFPGAIAAEARAGSPSTLP